MEKLVFSQSLIIAFIIFLNFSSFFFYQISENEEPQLQQELLSRPLNVNILCFYLLFQIYDIYYLSACLLACLCNL